MGLGLLSLAAPAAAAVVPGTILLRQGDVPTGGPAVVDVHMPFVNASSEVGFVGEYDDGDHFVFVGDSVVWEGSDDPMNVLSAIAPSMDSNGLGAFVYAVDVNGAPALRTHLGTLALAGDLAVGFIPGSTYTSFSFPSMTGDGAVYWRAGVDTNGDGLEDGYGLFRAPDGTLASAEVLLRSGQPVGAFVIDDDASGIDGNYAVSEDGLHRIGVLGMEGAAASDAFVWVDGALVARELDPIPGAMDSWDRFDVVAINASGHYLFTGDSDGPDTSDELLAYNGTVVLREGDVVAGITLSSSATTRYVAINDLDQAAFVWGYDPLEVGYRETVFFSCDASDLVGTAQAVMTTHEDELDVDGDGAGDFQIVDLTLIAPAPSRILGESPFLYVQLALDDGLSVTEAMVELPVSCCGNGLPDPFEECDDGNLDDADECPSTCAAAHCGDGFVLAGVEECDDGNLDDADGCASDCTVTGGTSSGLTAGDGTAGVDDTAGDGAVGEVGSGGGSGVGEGDAGGATETSGVFGGTAGETESEPATAGAIPSADSSCSCRSGQRPLRGLVGSVLALGLLGLGRRGRPPRLRACRAQRGIGVPGAAVGRAKKLKASNG